MRETYREYRQDQGQLMAAAMVYYAVLSIIPLLLILLSIFGVILRISPNGNLEQFDINN
jgi:uncharacterized BrkB/YihY/UPF0761 family membrane protein